MSDRNDYKQGQISAVSGRGSRVRFPLPETVRIHALMEGAESSAFPAMHSL